MGQLGQRVGCILILFYQFILGLSKISVNSPDIKKEAENNVYKRHGNI